MHVVDWNNDGLQDVLIQWNSGYVSVYLGRSGGFGNGQMVGSSGWAAITLTVGNWVSANPYPGVVGYTGNGDLYHWSNRFGGVSGWRRENRPRVGGLEN